MRSLWSIKFSGPFTTDILRMQEAGLVVKMLLGRLVPSLTHTNEQPCTPLWERGWPAELSQCTQASMP